MPPTTPGNSAHPQAPSAPPSTAPAPTAPAAGAAAASRRVLIADDTEETILQVSAWLKKAGYEVQTAADGRECLDKFETFKPHAVVVDIMMPNVHGMDVLRQIKALPQNGTIGVIVMSARAFEPDKERAVTLGAFGYLIKPLQRQQMLDVLEAFFSGAAPAQKVNMPPVALPSTDEIYLPELDTSRGTLHLYGVRGSTPVPGSSVARYGGNTSCLEIRHGKNVVVLDAGTGIRECGLELAKLGPRPVSLFIGHTHWDHIQGFPFFNPAYIPGFELISTVPAASTRTLRAFSRGSLTMTISPSICATCGPRCASSRWMRTPCESATSISIGSMRGTPAPRSASASNSRG